MTVNNIVEWYQDEISHWDFYSDSQRAGIDNGHIIVCLRSYDWYITKDKIEDAETAVKALFEITWLSEFNDESQDLAFINFSKYWRKYV